MWSPRCWYLCPKFWIKLNCNLKINPRKRRLLHNRFCGFHSQTRKISCIMCIYIYIYTYVYLRLHLKEIYPLCTLPSFCIAIPGYLLCTSVKSSNHTISHTIHIYIYTYGVSTYKFRLIFVMIFMSVNIPCGFFVAMGFPREVRPKPSPTTNPGLDLCPGVRYGAW